MSDRAIYGQQGFAGRLAKGERAALLVVDFVNGFVDPEVFGGGNCLEASRNSVPVLAEFRARGLPVVFTRIVYAEDGSDAGVWCEKAPRLRELTETSPASRVVDWLAPQPGEPVVCKTQASAFFGTGLEGLLRLRGVDSVAVVGATTSGCVRATVVDAISANFRPTVIADCVGDRARDPHEANLFDMEQKYANLLDASRIGDVF